MTTQTLKNWNKVRLDEIADFQYGYTASSKEDDTGTKLLRITDIVPDLIDWETVPFCDIDEKNAKQYGIKKGDILIARTGATAGYAKFIRREPEKSVFASYLIRLTMKKADASSEYVGRIIESDTFKQFVTSHASGSAQPHANAPILKDFEFLLPDLKTQVSVANILSVYDDLIYNNTRRIQILEQMALAIYTEWFVNFRFPGHKKVKMIDSGSDFGKIPEGWEIKKLKDVVYNFDSKRRPISKMKRAQVQGEIPYYGAAKIIDYVNEVLLDGKYLLFAEDGSVITKEGYPVLQFVNEKFWVSNHAHVLQGKDVSTEHLYLALSKFPIQGYVTGAAQPKITQENMNRISVLVSDANTRAEFDNRIQPLFELQFNLRISLANLRQTRDLLLPKLVTGEIKVNT